MQVLQLATIMPMYYETCFHIFCAVKMSTFLLVIHITMVDHLEMKLATSLLQQVSIAIIFQQCIEEELLYLGLLVSEGEGKFKIELIAQSNVSVEIL